MVEKKVAWALSRRPFGLIVTLFGNFYFFSVENTKGVAEGINEVSVFALDLGKLWGWLMSGSF